MRAALDPVARTAERAAGTAAVAEATTRALLDLLGWQGSIVRSSDLAASSDRSARPADLTVAVGAGTYVCGTGGMRYLDRDPFVRRHLTVRPFSTPVAAAGLWTAPAEITSLWALATYGPTRVAAAIGDLHPVG